MKELLVAALLCAAVCTASFAAACAGGDEGGGEAEETTYTIAFLGDSITYGAGCSRSSNRFSDLIGEEDFVKRAQNVGFSGSTVGHSGGEMDRFSFLNRYSEISESADLIFVLGGTNDYGSDMGEVPLGQPGDSGDDTFYGAYSTLLKNLTTEYPSATIVTATLFQRDNSVWGYPEGIANSYGNTLEEYCEAIEELSVQYNLTCVDFYNLEGMRLTDETFSTYFEDGLHPNDEGNKVIADYLVQVFKDILNVTG